MSRRSIRRLNDQKLYSSLDQSSGAFGTPNEFDQLFSRKREIGRLKKRAPQQKTHPYHNPPEQLSDEWFKNQIVSGDQHLVLPSSSQSPADRRSSKPKRSSADRRLAKPVRKKRRKLRTRAKWLLAAIAFVVLYLTILAIPQFRPLEVIVDERALLPAKTVQDEAKLPLGFHVLTASNGSFIDRLLGHMKAEEVDLQRNIPSLKNIHISFRFPAKWSIRTEHNGYFYLFHTTTQTLIIDDAGYVFATGADEDAARADFDTVIENGANWYLPIWHVSELSAEQAPSTPLESSYERFDRLPTKWVESITKFHELESVLKKLDQETPHDWAYHTVIHDFEIDGDDVYVSLNLQGQENMSDAAASVLRAVHVRFNLKEVNLQTLNWWKIALKTGKFNQLTEGVIDLTHEQIVYSPKADWIRSLKNLKALREHRKQILSSSNSQTSTENPKKDETNSSMMSPSEPNQTNQIDKQPVVSEQSTNLSSKQSAPQQPVSQDGIEFATQSLLPSVTNKQNGGSYLQDSVSESVPETAP